MPTISLAGFVLWLLIMVAAHHPRMPRNTLCIFGLYGMAVGGLSMLANSYVADWLIVLGAIFLIVGLFQNDFLQNRRCKNKG